MPKGQGGVDPSLIVQGARQRNVVNYSNLNEGAAMQLRGHVNVRIKRRLEL